MLLPDFDSITVKGISPPHPSPQRGEGRVRGPHIKEINAFVLVKTLLGLGKEV